MHAILHPPVPMKMTGDLVAATALSAPPPLAWPSSLVTMTAPTSTLSLKAFAWSWAAWPVSSSNPTSKQHRGGVGLKGTPGGWWRTSSKAGCVDSNHQQENRWLWLA
jgi:hypothetical protein